MTTAMICPRCGALASLAATSATCARCGAPLPEVAAAPTQAPGASPRPAARAARGDAAGGSSVRAIATAAAVTSIVLSSLQLLAFAMSYASPRGRGDTGPRWAMVMLLVLGASGLLFAISALARRHGALLATGIVQALCTGLYVLAAIVGAGVGGRASLSTVAVAMALGIASGIAAAMAFWCAAQRTPAAS